MLDKSKSAYMACILDEAGFELWPCYHKGIRINIIKKKNEKSLYRVRKSRKNVIPC